MNRMLGVLFVLCLPFDCFAMPARVVILSDSSPESRLLVRRLGPLLKNVLLIERAGPGPLNVFFGKLRENPEAAKPAGHSSLSMADQPTRTAPR